MPATDVSNHPVTAAKDGSTMSDPGPGQAARADVTVLVVEDECLIRIGATLMLEAEGYRVRESDCALGGLAELDLHPEVQVLFTDINMPGNFDGIELARRVHARRPDIHLILTSGLMRPTAAELFGGQFMAKPYCDRELGDLIADAVRRGPLSA